MGRITRRRRQIEEPAVFSITSLMDIMTIILVFLLKNYSADPVQLKQSAELHPPFSIATLHPEQSTSVTVTTSELMVDDKAVLQFSDGKISTKDLNGNQINALFDMLKNSVQLQKKVASLKEEGKFNGVITVIADRNVPFDLLSKVMFTAGQAEYDKFKFMVVKKGD